MSGTSFRFLAAFALAALAGLVAAGAALAQIEQAHLRIDGMT